MRHSGARLAICMPQSKQMFEGRGIAFAEIEASAPSIPKARPSPKTRSSFSIRPAPPPRRRASRTPIGRCSGTAASSAPEHGLHEASRVLCAAPLSHLYGLYSLHCAWAVGACTVLLARFQTGRAWFAGRELKPTALWTAPAHVAACRARGRVRHATTGPRSSSRSYPAPSRRPPSSATSPRSCRAAR